MSCGEDGGSAQGVVGGRLGAGEGSPRAGARALGSYGGELGGEQKRGAQPFIGVEEGEGAPGKLGAGEGSSGRRGGAGVLFRQRRHGRGAPARGIGARGELGFGLDWSSADVVA
jgi:hypothetical protein